MNQLKSFLGVGLFCLVAVPVAAIDPHYLTHVDYAAGSSPQQVCIADFNGDTKPDLAVVNALSNDVSVLMNNGNGTYAPAVNYIVGSHPTSMCSIDVDADGFPDLAVTNFGSASISVLMNLTDGTFDPAISFSTGIQPNSICAADFDADNKIDLAVANSGTGDVLVMINLNNSKFPTAVSYPTGNSPVGICTGDFNADGRPDLAAVNSADDNLSVLRNTGGGIFAAAVNYAVGTSPAAVGSADLDANGSIDLAVANSGSNSVSVLKNNGTGSFSSTVNYPAGTAPTSILVSDLDKDARPELTLTNDLVDSVSVLRNNGNGTFSVAVTHTAGFGPHSVAAGDFDGDGMLDLAVANSSSGNASVLIGVRQWRVTASAGANGTIDPIGIVGTYEGSDLSFSMLPNTGYHVANVVADGTSLGAVTSHTFTAIAANHTINVTFAINTYTLTATAGPNGSISPSGVTSVNYGGEQTYSISPATCYHIADVLLDGVSVGAVGSLPVTNVSANHTIDAVFAIDVYTITVSAGPHGSISPSGTISADCGTSKTFTITPDFLFYVSDVKVDGVSVGAVTSHTINPITKDYLVSAVFSCCGGLTGNVDCDAANGRDISDLSTLIDNLYINFTPLCCGAAANVDGQPGNDISDLSALIDFLYISFTLPKPCQ